MDSQDEKITKRVSEHAYNRSKEFVKKIKEKNMGPLRFDPKMKKKIF